MKMPAIFFGHGSPMNALETNKFTQSWVEVANYIPRPMAILSISAHWETAGVNVTNNKKMRTNYNGIKWKKAYYSTIATVPVFLIPLPSI